jgi:recombination DNA repair RAD52 pathway protein
LILSLSLSLFFLPFLLFVFLTNLNVNTEDMLGDALDDEEFIDEGVAMVDLEKERIERERMERSSKLKARAKAREKSRGAAAAEEDEDEEPDLVDAFVAGKVVKADDILPPSLSGKSKVPAPPNPPPKFNSAAAAAEDEEDHELIDEDEQA